jgi:phosphate ABC transporter phosphate-binding protein
MTGEPETLPVSREQFLQNLTDSGLLAAEDVRVLLGADPEAAAADGRALARRLVEAGKLTAYQARALLEGRLKDLRIGAYDVLELLGKGAMGTVYKARHRRMKRLAALKVLAPEVAAQSAFAQRFQREVEALAQLSHANVIMAFDAGEAEVGPFLAMEFVDGRDLASEVKERGPLGLADALECTLQAARGLEYAHARGLVHRDIKPANLMRDAGGLVKVADLGLARMRNPSATEHVSALTQAGSILGTVDYMAPEQALDSTATDGRADVYSLGCTLFYLLTGRPMYSGTSLMGLLLKHREAPPPSLSDSRPGVPEVVNAVFQRMVAKKPEDRYQTMAEVADALEEVRRETASVELPDVAPQPPAPAAGSSAAEMTVDAPSARQLTDHGARPGARAASTLSGAAPGASTLTAAPARPAARPGPPPAGPQPPAGAAPRAGRRALVAAAVLAVLLAAAGLAWWQLTRGGASAEGPEAGGQKPPEQKDQGVSPHDVPGQTAKAGPFAGTILNGGGSTFINPLMQHWARVYQQRQGVRVDYQSVGSGRGTAGVLNRVYLFGCSDAPLTDKQLAQAKQAGGSVLHIPLVLGAVVPAYNLPGVRGQLRLTGPTLADIYLGKIARWNDPALRIANPGLDLPDMPITPVHRADASGTTFIWTDYLGKVSGEWKARVGAGTLVKWPVGKQGTGNNGVANLVSRNVGALGYLELTYALENNLHFAQVKNRDGKFIAPNLDSVTAAAGALTDLPADLRFSLTDAAGEDTYPVAGTTYALLYADQTRNPSGRDLVAFLRWATHEGQAYAPDLRYAPLPPELVRRIDATLDAVRLAPR